MNLRKDILTFWLIDVVLVCAAWWISFWLRFNFEIPVQFIGLALHTTGWTAICFFIGLGVARVHRQAWRYIGLPELRQLSWGILIGGVLSATAVLMLLASIGLFTPDMTRLAAASAPGRVEAYSGLATMRSMIWRLTEGSAPT